MRGGETNQERSRGFTIIELLVVMTIIAIIVAIMIPALQNSIEKVKQRSTMGDMHSIATGVSMYQIDISIFPGNAATAADLVAAIQPFTKNTLPSEDKWSHDYSYTSDSFNWYSLESFGKDGVDGVDISFATRNQYTLDLVLVTGQSASAPE